MLRLKMPISMKRSELFFTFLLVPIDYLVVLAAFSLAYSTRIQSEVIYVWAFLDYFRFVVVLSTTWVAVFSLVGLYSIETPRRPFEELKKVFIGVSTSIMLLVGWFFLSRTEFFSRLVILYAWIYAIILVYSARLAIHGIQQYLLRFGVGVHRVLVIGANGASKRVIRTIQQDRSLGFKLVRMTDRNAIGKIESIVARQPIDEIILADPTVLDQEVDRLMLICQERGYTLRLIPNLYRLHPHTSIQMIHGVPLIEFQRTPLQGWGKITKRLIDLFGALIGLVVLSPIFLFCMIGIKIASPKGPIFFRQTRVGYGGLFTFYKFRTMVPDAEKVHERLIQKYGNMFKLKDDPRVFRFGRLLRRYSLDELPQLWNVLKGEMSLIGPRPPMPQEVKHYSAWQRQRLGIKPGITGLWQVSGRSDLSFDDWIKLDIYYIENWSLWFDCQILLKTFWVVIIGKGAY